MVKLEEYGNYETAWCPGCGNFGILDALKEALILCNLSPHNILLVSGIGQAAKLPHYLNCNFFNGLHGRSLPVAIGAKLANPEFTVIAESGDGCMYGEGGNHFLAAIRRNINITAIVHNNMVYGLTKGQASPTSQKGFTTKAQPTGTFSTPFNPVEVAVAMDASFVARGFSGMKHHLAHLIAQAITHKGFSLVDILQPCVSFNHVNTYSWYHERCKVLSEDYNPMDRDNALITAHTFGDEIPLGIIYKNEREVFEDNFPLLKKGPLCKQPFRKDEFGRTLDKYS